MNDYSAYARGFDLYPQSGIAFDHLSPLFAGLNQVDFLLRVNDPRANQGQLSSNFDCQLKDSVLSLGATSFELPLPPGIPQELDFAFAYSGRSVAVEIEKANREKILRDLLKCHMYLHAGADFAMIVLPKNYPHKHGVWNLFDFGIQRYRECLDYGFGIPERLNRIAFLGFTQFEATTGKPLCVNSRQRMRLASLDQSKPPEEMLPYGAVVS